MPTTPRNDTSSPLAPLRRPGASEHGAGTTPPPPPDPPPDTGSGGSGSGSKPLAKR
jgi:hypothetical protein